MTNNTKPIFIGGTGRSGTTILSKILGKHPEIFRFPCETRFIIDPDGIIDLVPALSDNWSPYIGSKAVYSFKEIMYLLGQRESLFDKIKSKIKVNLLNSSPKKYLRFPLGNVINRTQYYEMVDDFLNKLIDAQFEGYWIGSDSHHVSPKILSTKKFSRKEIVNLSANFIQQLFSIPVKRENKNYWLDHTPFNVLHADFLNELFPDMKLIHIYRDIRDVISSYKTKSWGGVNAEDIVLWQKQILKSWLKIKDNLHKDNYYELKLENLIENPERKLREILNFLGLAFEEEILKINLTKDSCGRWQKDLNKKEVSLIKKELSNIMLQYDYEW